MRTRLVERAREGDDVAFSELVDLDGDLCYAIAYRILRDAERAQDAVQQAFLLAWRELPRLRDPERFGPGSIGCSSMPVTRSCAAIGDGASRIRVLPVDGPGGPDPTVSVDDRDTLDRAFQRLTPEHRAVFVLHHHAGLAAGRDRRHRRRPGRNGEVPAALRHPNPARGDRRGQPGRIHGGTTGMTVNRAIPTRSSPRGWRRGRLPSGAHAAGDRGRPPEPPLNGGTGSGCREGDP